MRSELSICVVSFSSDKLVVVADSESSSIRIVDFESKRIRHLTGGNENDPRDLFAFGDSDGPKALLQHPLGVVALDDGVVFTDSYNNKLKFIPWDTNLVESITIEGIEKGSLREPSGLSFSKKMNALLIADANNHRIIKVDWNTKKATEVIVKW
jgi:WD40 repeat protein